MEQARTLLGCFLFSHQDIDKKIGVLSGGEKNRVSMVKVLLQDANFLLLDEPTNHLDIPSKDILLKALKNYQGTLLFVSHDHDFIDELATHIVALDANGTKTYHGNYTDYKNAIAAYSKSSSLAKQPPLIPSARQSGKQRRVYRGTDRSPKAPEVQKPGKQYELQKTSKKLERKIAQLETSIKKVQNSFVDLEYGSPEFETQNIKLQELDKQLATTFTEWETIQKQLE